MKSILLIFFILIEMIFCFGREKSNQHNLQNKSNLNDSISIKYWYNNKGSAFSFTFDDGFITDYEYVRPVLNNFNYKGTFYVITGSLTDSLPGIWRYGTWQHFKQLHDDGNEIGSHTVTHPHMTLLDPGDTLTPGTIEYEAYQSKKVIDSIFTDTQCITFAYPYAEYDSVVVNIVKKYYQSARGLDINPNPGSVYGDQYYELKSKEEDFDLPRNTPADDEDEFVDATNWIQNSIDSSGWAILMIHEVFPFDSIQWALSQGSWYPMSVEWLTQLCEWIQNKNIWVSTVANITKYMHERECASAYFVSLSNDSLKFNLTDTLDNSIYNFPLTVDVPIPAVWDSVFVYQNGIQMESNLLNESGSKIVRTNVVPDEGQILVTNSPVLLVQDNKNTLPRKFKLYQNYPNPFNPVTAIKFTLPQTESITLTIYNVLGQMVEVLINDKVYSAGDHEVNFNAFSLSSGVYIYSLKTDKNFAFRKMMIIK